LRGGVWLPKLGVVGYTAVVVREVKDVGKRAGGEAGVDRKLGNRMGVVIFSDRKVYVKGWRKGGVGVKNSKATAMKLPPKGCAEQVC